MADEPPKPPVELSTDIVDTLNEYSAEQLQHIARYAEELGEHKARQARLQEEADKNEPNDRQNDIPADVPSKATIKTINDNRYYYWQWREGDTVTSKFKGPVDTDE